jgi:hypothetical protein
MTRQELTAQINKLQRRHPGTRRQRSSHGAGRYSVAFFDKKTGRLVKDYNLGDQVGWTKNPGGKSLTLHNMALVTIKRLPGGAVAVSGRKMAGRRANPKRKPAKRR